MTAGTAKVKRRGFLITASILFFILVFGSAGFFSACFWYNGKIDEVIGGADGEFLVVPAGASIRQVAGLLESRRIVGSAFLFRLHMRLEHRHESIKAGEYRFIHPVTVRRVAAQLVEGRVYYHRITVPEGLDWQETAETLSRQGFGESRQFLDLIADPGPILDLDPEARNLEGYLFPETYFVTRDATPEEIIGMMVERFRKNWSADLAGRAESLGLSVREAVTLASLIEKETALPGERPLVSSVFHNRLQRGQKLACDPTVIYAVKLVKPWDGVINQSDLKLDSPYNTYLYPGLPPGPIASPGLASIRAALFPEETDFLFFVSRNDGSHIFSSNYRDHAAAVNRYQR